VLSSPLLTICQLSDLMNLRIHLDIDQSIPEILLGVIKSIEEIGVEEHDGDVRF